MVGIASYGAYVPRYRLGAETAGWNSTQERSIANFDEDSITMAVAAGLDCLRGLDRESVDGLVFATTTPPYAEKQCASVIANALDLRRDIFAADVTDVLRAGTTALKSALDSVSAGSAQQVLVVASAMEVQNLRSLGSLYLRPSCPLHSCYPQGENESSTASHGFVLPT